MLPRLVATVMRIRVKVSVFLSSNDFISAIAKGTRVTRVTSFVRIIPRKNESHTSISETKRDEWTFERSLFVSLSKTPRITSSETTSIMQNRIAKTLKSMYPMYFSSGCTKKQDTIASIPEMNNTGSFLMRSNIAGRLYICRLLLSRITFDIFYRTVKHSTFCPYRHR